MKKFVFMECWLAGLDLKILEELQEKVVVGKTQVKGEAKTF